MDILYNPGMTDKLQEARTLIQTALGLLDDLTPPRQPGPRVTFFRAYLPGNLDQTARHLYADMQAEAKINKLPVPTQTECRSILLALGYRQVKREDGLYWV